MTKHNEYGAELFLSAMERYQSGTSNIRAALRDAAKGYGEMYRHIVASNGGVEPKGPAMAKALKDILTTRGPTANNVSSWIDDRTQRMALLWMDQNSDRVAWVFSNSEAATPMSIYNAWKAYFRKTVKAEWEENEAEGGVEPKDLLGVALPGVTLDEVEAEWTRLAELKAKREEEKPVPEPTPEPTPVPDVNPIMILRDWLLEANDRELDAIQTLINERRERLKPVTQAVEAETKAAVKHTYLKAVGDVVDAIKPETCTLALMKGNSSSRAATIRVSRRVSKVTIDVDGDYMAHEFSFKGKSLSVTMLKRFIMDAMLKHGTFPPEGGAEQISPSAGPVKHDAAFQLYLQH